MNFLVPRIQDGDAAAEGGSGGRGGPGASLARVPGGSGSGSGSGSAAVPASGTGRAHAAGAAGGVGRPSGRGAARRRAAREAALFRERGRARPCAPHRARRAPGGPRRGGGGARARGPAGRGRGRFPSARSSPQTACPTVSPRSPEEAAAPVPAGAPDTRPWPAETTGTGARSGRGGRGCRCAVRARRPRVQPRCIVVYPRWKSFQFFYVG
ncbi:uncharacterized protein [Equus przewalskii]|uniref:Uncharacterized protein n=1 Tax=Equus przewalskii TaxID=9798 RepID=A0ABM4PF47_EQUPR